MKALVLAAGKGTRLGSLTARVPKPMLPVGDRPLLAHTIDWLRRHGIRQVAVNLHHAADVITGYFGAGSSVGVEIEYSYEEQLLGTAGAVKRLQWFLDESFAVIYGDVLTNLDLTALRAYHEAHVIGSPGAAIMTMALYHVPDPLACGIVEVDHQDRITRFQEKPRAEQVFSDLANAGVLMCEPTILDYIPPETAYDFGRDVLPNLVELGVPILGRVISEWEYVVDIGTPDGYERAQRLMLAGA
jgi:NDP-sugar pyrophosphorylase family protein